MIPHTPASFSGPQKLYEAAVKQDSTVTLNAVKSWLSGKETYIFHKPSRKKFKRNKVIVGTIDQQWDVDLMDVTKIAKYDGYHFILLAVDMYGRCHSGINREMKLFVRSQKFLKKEYPKLCVQTKEQNF